MTAPEFDWTGEDADSVVIGSQPAVAFYENPNGHYVLRQEGQYHPDEDQWIYIQPENLEALALILLNAARSVQRDTNRPVKRRRTNGNGETDTPLLSFASPEGKRA